nr:carbamoyl-phosphate synthase domain-containing protein [Candidatus Brachybacter algidus]
MPDKSIPAVLLLADGTVAHGFAFGAIGTTTGEICFNTGMTGYQEVFTDPSYFGQILIMNSAHIGNYGVKEADVESDSVKINGLVGRNLEDLYSRKMANGSLNEYLKTNKVVSIEGVDTRALVAHVRTKGAMNCIISSETTDIEILKKKLAETPDMDGLELASKVSTTQAYELGDTNSHSYSCNGLWSEAKYTYLYGGKRGTCKGFPGKDPIGRSE